MYMTDYEVSAIKLNEYLSQLLERHRNNEGWDEETLTDAEMRLKGFNEYNEPLCYNIKGKIICTSTFPEIQKLMEET